MCFVVNLQIDLLVMQMLEDYYITKVMNAIEGDTPKETRQNIFQQISF